MEETSKELPNFSIGIDLLGPDLTNNKSKAEKLTSCTFRKFVGRPAAANFGGKTFKKDIGNVSSQPESSTAAITVRQNNSVVVAQEKTVSSSLSSPIAPCTAA